MYKIDKNVKNTMRRMILGDIIYNLIIFAIFLVLFIFTCYNNKDEVYIFIRLIMGLFLGLIFSISVIINMGYTLDFAYNANDESFAKNYIIKYSVIRNIIFAIILIALIKIDFFGKEAAIGFFVGALGTKFGTYIGNKFIK